MTEDLGTTQRKPLTPRQRLKLYEDHRGMCALCSRKIEAGEPWRDEHLRALGLSGSNKSDNRAPVHIACAEAKDKADIPAIAKAKRRKMVSLGLSKSSRPIPQPRKVEKIKRDQIAVTGRPAIARRYQTMGE